jgi:hypothetical protein
MVNLIKTRLRHRDMHYARLCIWSKPLIENIQRSFHTLRWQVQCVLHIHMRWHIWLRESHVHRDRCTHWRAFLKNETLFNSLVSLLHIDVDVKEHSEIDFTHQKLCAIESLLLDYRLSHGKRTPNSSLDLNLVFIDIFATTEFVLNPAEGFLGDLCCFL